MTPAEAMDGKRRRVVGVYLLYAALASSEAAPHADDRSDGVPAKRLSKMDSFVRTGFAPRERVALMFVHPMKSGGTSVRFAMHKLNTDWTHVGYNFCFNFRRDSSALSAPGFLDRNPRLYFEFHCAPYEVLANDSSLWQARDFLRARGWKVVTGILLRHPVFTLPSYYGHFGPGHPRHGRERKLGASVSDFARAHAEFSLCSIWGMHRLCDNPLDQSEAEAEPPPRPMADASALARARFGHLSDVGLDRTAVRLLSAGHAEEAVYAFARFARALRLNRGQFAEGCGFRRGLLALADVNYQHCEQPDAYRALVEVQVEWASFQAAVRDHSPNLCSRQVRELDARLSRLDVVGLTERWDESFLLLAQELGVQKFPRVMVNVKSVSAEQTERTRALSATLGASESCGVHLYERWAARFRRRVDMDGGELNRSLTALRGSFHGQVLIAHARPLRARTYTSDPARALSRQRQQLLKARVALGGDGAAAGTAEVPDRLR
ncbi:hypothetical protein T492DRAFT_964944 [Pavlovales sp. CCMP2436]|nr:hypothetical protein T492DRAFT_964944 [Pavlovales sp. CCMP2436]